MKKFFPWLCGAVLLALFSCQTPVVNERHATVQCMDSTHIFFAPSTNWDSLRAFDGWRRWDNGRFLTRTVGIPTFHVRPTITAHVTLRSAGDPWDKSGSLVLLPDAAPNLLDVGFTKDTLAQADYPGIALNEAERANQSAVGA